MALFDSNSRYGIGSKKLLWPTLIALFDAGIYVIRVRNDDSVKNITICNSKWYTTLICEDMLALYFSDNIFHVTIITTWCMYFTSFMDSIVVYIENNIYNGFEVS